MTDIFAELEADAARAQVTSAPTDAESSTIGKLGLELAQIEDRLEKWGAVAKMLEERREIIMRRELVDAMDAIGQDKMGLPQFNCDIVTGDYVKAGLPNPDSNPKDTLEEKQRKAELRAEGLAWLADEGHDGVIATTLMLSMPKGSLELAEVMQRTLVALFGRDATVNSRLEFLMEEMDENDPESIGLLQHLAERNAPGIDPASVGIDESVHWATLTSLVKDLLKKEGSDKIPMEALGASSGRIAKIVKRKAAK